MNTDFFPFIYASLTSFSNILQFSMNKSLAAWVKFIPNYYTHFYATVNGTVSLISFGNC